MRNKYNLPEDKLEKIKKRDKRCVYCYKKMVNPKKGGKHSDWATIEHLNHLPPWDNIDTIAMCCGSCNSSRRNRKITEWFKNKYCIERNINYKTVADSVKSYIKKYEY